MRLFMWAAAGWALLLTACGSPLPPSTPTPAPLLETAAIASPPASATPAPPTLTPSASATASPPPTRTSTVTPTPPILNPLTGRPLADPATLDRRPLAIKIAHFPRRVREAQAGLSYADNVWEHYAEGGVTRFTAIFWGQAPERAGNVRSARLIDAILGDAYQAVLVASGSSTGTMNRLRENQDLYRRIVAEATGYSECPLLCREESAALTTNKLFTSPPELWKLADEQGFGPPEGLTGFAFAEPPPAAGRPIGVVHLDFQLGNTIAEWRYNPAAREYARWIDAAGPDGVGVSPDLVPHVDTLNGQALAAANVVVLVAPYVPSNIREAEGGNRYFSYDIQLTGEGPAYVFRDGRMLEGRWQRAEAPHSLPRLVDSGGSVIPLRPGVTWFEILSVNSPAKIDEAAGVFQARFRAPDPFPATPTPAPP